MIKKKNVNEPSWTWVNSITETATSTAILAIELDSASSMESTVNNETSVRNVSAAAIPVAVTDFADDEAVAEVKSPVRAELIKEARMSASPQSTQLPVARMLRPQTAAERYILTTDVTIAGGVKLTADPCPTVSALPTTVTTPLLAIRCWASSVVTARVKLHRAYVRAM